MTILTPIFIYILFPVIAFLILNYSFKRNKTIQRIKRWTVGLSVALFVPLTITYFIFVFGSRFERHYDVQKGTLLWYATMDNNTITEFPILKPVGNVTYNSIGGGSPEIGAGWEIEYVSQEKNQKIETTIIEYLKNRGFKIEKVDELQYYGAGSNKNSKSSQLYSGSNKNGEILDLQLDKNRDLTTRIECSIIL